MSAEEAATRCERRLLEAAGVLVDVREGDPRRDDLARGRDWGSERTVRADLLRDLLTNTTRDISALRLRGARITGALDLDGTDLTCRVLLQDCSFEETVSLRQTRAPMIRLQGCHLPSLEAVQLDVRGNLILDGLVTISIDLRGAQVARVLTLDGAILTNPRGITLSGGALSVGQGMSCSHGFISNGLIGLYGAVIPQGLSFIGAKLENAAGWALDAQGMHVGKYLFLGSSLSNPEGFIANGGLRLVGVHVDGFVSFWGGHIKPHKRFGSAIAGLGLTISQNLLMNEGFIAEGEVYLTNANIADEIDLEGATLINPQGRALSAERLVIGDSVLCTKGFAALGAVDLSDSKIGGSLDFTGALLHEPAGNTLNLRGVTARTLIARPARPPHQIDLRHASVVVLDDDPTTWPARLLLRDFTYENLEYHPSASVSTRLRWLEKDVEGYIPQPYEQLTSAYRRAGQEEAARNVALAKRRRQRQVLNPPAKIWNWLLYLTIGYGYRTWQAGLWLLGLMVAGTAVFAHAYPAHMTATGQHPMQFNAPIYTLDVLLPIISLGQQDSWQPTGIALSVYWTLIILGWALTSALIAGLTGLVKRDQR
jgi:hypothetical protein